jgi:hypothetical protein
MTIDALPSAPLPTDNTATFNSKAFALVAALNTFVNQANALGIAVDADAVSAAADSITAANASLAAVGAANYKGEWSTLTGALNIPASVSHNGGVWVLKANLADVTTAVPGVSNQWLSATFSTGKAIAMSIVFGG